MNRISEHSIKKYIRLSLGIDLPLLFFIMLLSLTGLIILYSASNQSYAVLLRQIAHLLSALVLMFVMAFIPPHKYKAWTPYLYTVGLVLLFAVMIIGKIGKGAQRWLDLGIFRFQPSEIMKLAVPMMLAWVIEKYKLPLTFKSWPLVWFCWGSHFYSLPNNLIWVLRLWSVWLEHLFYLRRDWHGSL